MNSSAAKIIAGMFVVVILAFLVWEFALKDKPSSEKIVVEDQVTTKTQSTSKASSKSVYKDGTYEARGQYQSPAALENVDVTVTLKDGNIVDATFVGHPSVPTTELMQGKFKAGFKAEVVGKPIDQVKLTVVNGSSLSPKGFMDALQKIKDQAKA